MSRVLLYAHDPGGALMLAAAAGAAMSRGHQLAFRAAGPSVSLWRNAGFDVIDDEIASAPEFHGIDVVVTGTGFSDREQDMWVRARAVGLPSLAVVDAWTSLARRFEAEDGHVQPDAVGVLDHELADVLDGMAWWRGKTYVVGQPHLQSQTAELVCARAARTMDRRMIVFFSEPIREDYGDTRGFDQFEVFEGLMVEYDQAAHSEIVVKPHPREDAAAWEHVVQGRAQLSSASAADLLTACDGVIGMTTMVLIEAHLLGLPVLSLQPGRTGNANPLVEDATSPVLAWSAFPDAWQAYYKSLGIEQTISTRFNGLLRDADQRLVDAVEATVENNERELKC